MGRELEAARVDSSFTVGVELLKHEGARSCQMRMRYWEDERKRVVGDGMVGGEEPGFICLKGGKEKVQRSLPQQ